MIEIVIENLHQRQQIESGATLAEIAKQYAEVTQAQYPILGAVVNNIVRTLDYRLYKPKRIRFLDIKSPVGYEMYRNSLCLMLYKAVKECYPDAILSIQHTLQGSLYCQITRQKDEETNPKTVAKMVREKMIELQEADLPFGHETMEKESAARLMKEQGLPETSRLINGLNQLYIDIQFLGETAYKTPTALVPSTGCLNIWDFRRYEQGYLLQCADTEHPDKLAYFEETPKTFKIFQEHHRWAEVLHVPTIPDLNAIVRQNGSNRLIHVAEALHEKKYGEIAQQIADRKEVRLVLLAGPSSSGKTTSCRRLSVHLNVLGIDVKQLSLDDYYLSRAKTPKLPNGEYDFESVNALDIPLLNEHLQKLFAGEEVAIPTFDFKKGDPYYSGKTLKLGKKSLLLVEGIHALNPGLTGSIDNNLKFKVYVSALTQIAIDEQNIIHCSDNRLIRRMVRDNNFRGWDAYNTLHHWSEVQRGEQEHIFPYQEEADAMFNSALLYELGVLKVYAEPLLKRVPQQCEEYAEAQRLLTFLDIIDPIESKFIPPTSIMREFLGGSSFEY